MRKEILSTNLLAFFALLIFSFTGEIETRSLQQICSSSCGSIRNISYPFRLKGDPPSCGDSDYELACENNVTILEFHSGKYYVKQISYEMRTIRVVDVNFSNGTCNLPYKSVSFEEVEGDIRYQGRFLQTYASFMNCSTIISDPAYRRLPCLGGNGNTTHFYVIYNSFRLSDLPSVCDFVSTTPLAFSNVRHPSYEAILSLLESGFVLEWSVECRDCLLSNSTCAISTYELPFNYHCSKSDSVVLIVTQVFFSFAVSILI
ncbi:unnamed protein product, partial [Ilex paraguariensis]